MPDFMGGILVFTVVLTIFLFSWNSVEINQQKFSAEDQIRQDAYYTTTFLVSTPGYPENWTSETVEIPGFASEDNVLSMQKLREFGRLGYAEQKTLLQGLDFSLNITSSENDLIISYGSYSSNSSTVVPIRRNVLVEKLETENEVLWSYDPKPEKQNAVYGINHTVQPGSAILGNSIESLDVEIDASSEVLSETSQESVLKAGVDRNNDGVIETDISQEISEWEVEVESQNQLQIGFSESAYTDAEVGDSILIDLGNITNPSVGEYSIRTRANEDGGWLNDELGIGDQYKLPEKTLGAELELVVWR